MENLKISLIIPAYNEELYIGDCLKYAIKSSQSSFFEIIVVNNASTDRTVEIAQKFVGVRVVNEPNKGLTYARQRGFLEAKGNVLAYIDADTRMPSGWYNRVEREFSSNSNLACLSGPYVYYDLNPLFKYLVSLYWYILALPMYFFVGYMTVGGNFAIRRDVIEKMNGFDTTITFYGEDTDIARRASKFGKVKFMARLFMNTSGRRLSHEGFFKTGFVYAKNFLSEVFMHKPVTNEYKDIR
jgi:glycosyltransferase involved in cell wall biosynthesis